MTDPSQTPASAHAMPAPEFSHCVDIRHLPRGVIKLSAGPEARAALARRFAIVGIDRLEAELTLAGDAERLNVSGTLQAKVVQTCRVSAEPFATTIKAQVDLAFVPEAQFAAMEISAESADDEDEDGGHGLAPDDCDLMPYSGSVIDLGEAVAQTLALEINPWAEGPNADSFRAAHGLAAPSPSNPFDVLKSLKTK